MICSTMHRTVTTVLQFWTFILRELSIIAIIQAKTLFVWIWFWKKRSKFNQQIFMRMTDKMEGNYRQSLHLNWDKSISIMDAMFHSEQNKAQKPLEMKWFGFFFMFSLNSIKLCCTFLCQFFFYVFEYFCVLVWIPLSLFLARALGSIQKLK